LDVSASANRQDRLDELAASIEQELILLGATGIEDRLQDDVPKSIKLLMSANIRLWVLTGDHVETAISIATACGLIRSAFSLIVISLKQALASTGSTSSRTAARRSCSFIDPSDLGSRAV
jgi:magnesium-transporting ATPase (P-type)